MEKNNKVIFLLLCLILFTIVSCGGGSIKFFYHDPLFSKPMSIAVLPFANNTTDLPAGELTRILFAAGMMEKGYEVLDYDKTNEILNNLGITDGGQLGSISETELQGKLGVQGLVYGTLLEAAYTTKGVMSKKSITLHVKIVNNGKRVWEGEKNAKDSSIGNLMNPLKGLASQVANKTFEKAFAKYKGHPLDAFAEAVVVKLQEKIPGKRVEKSGWN